MQESAIYQEIKQEGIREGIREGIQEGIQRGERALILRLLRRKIGDLSVAMQQQIDQLSPDRLDTLGDALLEFSTAADLADWLQAHA